MYTEIQLYKYIYIYIYMYNHAGKRGKLHFFMILNMCFFDSVFPERAAPTARTFRALNGILPSLSSASSRICWAFSGVTVEIILGERGRERGKGGKGMLVSTEGREHKEREWK